MAKSKTPKSAKEADSGIGGITKPAAGMPPGNTNCQEGYVFDATTGQCVPIEGEGSMTPEAPPKVLGEPAVSDGGKSSEARGNEAEDDEEEDDMTVKESDIQKIRENLDKLFPSKESSKATEDDEEEEEEETKMPSKENTGRDNADLVTERRRTVEHLRMKKLAELKAELEANELKLQAQEQLIRKRNLATTLRNAKESAIPRFKSATEKYDLATEIGVLRPAQWFTAVRNEENVMNSHLWHVNKQNIFDSYGGRYLQKIGPGFAVEQSAFPEQFRKSVSATEAITGPPTNDFMRIMSEQVLVLPNGKVVTPVRQFCEVKILPPGTKEAFFYDYGSVDFQAITEGMIIPDSTTLVRSAGGATTPVGGRVEIPFSAIEETPIDLVTANNRAFALESVNSESVEVLVNAYNLDSGSAGDATTRKAKGGGTKDGRWVNGNTGAALTTGGGADAGITGNDTLSFKGIMRGKSIIRTNGLDVSNLVLYTSVKGIEDLIQDPSIDNYLSFSRPEVITEGVIEKVAGVNIVASSALAPLAMGGVAGGKRSVLFIPGVAFGLVSGRDLTMEAQRRNEYQIVHLTGTQKIAGFVKIVEATCRLSHA